MVDEFNDISSTPIAQRTRSKVQHTMRYHNVLFQQRKIELKHNLYSVEEKGVEYEGEEAQVLAKLMSCIMSDLKSKNLQMIQQYNFNRGLKIFGKKAKKRRLRKYDSNTQESVSVL